MSAVTCDSIRIADGPNPTPRLVRIVHPFHPLSGQQLRRVGENGNGAGRRVVCVGADGAVWSVPVGWTDLVEPRFERQLCADQAYVLVDDLLALAELTRRVRQ